MHIAREPADPTLADPFHRGGSGFTSSAVDGSGFAFAFVPEPAFGSILYIAEMRFRTGKEKGSWFGYTGVRLVGSRGRECVPISNAGPQEPSRGREMGHMHSESSGAS